MLSPQADAPGLRLGLDDYSEDFSRHFWRSGSEGFWKLERQQSFQKPGVESWEAFRKGHLDESLAPTSPFGMDLVQEVSRLLGSEHIRSTKISDDLTLWHAEIAPGRSHPGAPGPAASQFSAEHGSPPVTGPAVVTGEMLHGAPYPLDADKAAQIATHLGG